MSLLPRLTCSLVFGVAFFSSSLLLFVLEPMAGKALLPYLGGSPAVWNACLVFFQAAMLTGYLYAHSLYACRGCAWQPIVHALLLAGAAALLVMAPSAGRPWGLDWFAAPEESPVLATIAALAAALGLPILVLAATGTVLQRWFANTRHPLASDPYHLAVAGNLGGLTGLLGYALVVEPYLSLTWQRQLATSGLTVLAALTLLCAVVVWVSRRDPEPVLLPPVDIPETDDMAMSIRLVGRGAPTWLRRGRWLACAGIPVVLLMGLTAHLTGDIAPSPMLWVTPLALYLLSFIQAFGRFSPLDHGGHLMRVSLHSMSALLLAGLIVVSIIATSAPRELASMFVGTMLLWLVFMLTSWVNALQAIGTLVFFYFAIENTLLTPAAVLIQLAVFYLTARMCHRVLALDRPAAPFVTGYYAWIGVGGLLGGLFQIAVAPLVFAKIPIFLEYPLAAAMACALRPAWLRNGLVDQGVAMAAVRVMPALRLGTRRHRAWLAFGFDLLLGVACGGTVAAAVALANAPSWGGEGAPFAVWLSRMLDIVPGQNRFEVASWITFALVSCGCLVVVARPLRYALSLTVLAATLTFYIANRNPSELLVFSERTPHGIYRVTEGERRGANPFNPKAQARGAVGERQFMHTTTVHGIELLDRDMRRFGTTYYHRRGPAGLVLAKYDWFNPRDHRYPGDARMAAALVGHAAYVAGPLPLSHLGELWTEPPYAVVGMGVGSLFSYARPFQQVDSFELDPVVIRLSTAPPAERLFHFLEDAQERGAQVRIWPGDARLQMARHAPAGFYRMIFLDAFTSDAMPTHLLTREAVQLYFQKLHPDGILCIHTSNRYVDLPPMLAVLSDNLGCACLVGTDSAIDPDDPCHFTSQWVVLARDRLALDRGVVRLNIFEHPDRKDRVRWDQPLPRHTALWTDDHANPTAYMRSGEHFEFMQRSLVGLFVVAVLLGVVEFVAAALHLATDRPCKNYIRDMPAL